MTNWTTIFSLSCGGKYNKYYKGELRYRKLGSMTGGALGRILGITQISARRLGVVELFVLGSIFFTTQVFY